MRSGCVGISVGTHELSSEWTDRNTRDSVRVQLSTLPQFLRYLCWQALDTSQQHVNWDLFPAAGGSAKGDTALSSGWLLSNNWPLLQPHLQPHLQLLHDAPVPGPARPGPA